MKKLLLAAAVTLSTPVHASEWDDETVRNVDGGGSIVVLQSGSVYNVNPDDMRDMAFWEAGDHVLVCGDEEMINTDHGAEVHVTPAR